MKRFLLIVIAVAALSSCSFDPPVMVRYQNMLVNGSTGFDLRYGIKMGDAVYENPLPYGSVSSYIGITPGTYSIQFKTNTGTWLTVSTSAASPSSAGKYTIVITGNLYLNYYSFQLVKDS